MKQPDAPQSEKEWQEALSAYADGELDASACQALEAAMANAPERAAQLEEIYSVSDLLCEWRVEDAEPDPAFEKRLEALRRRKGRGAIANRLWSVRFLRHAAVFAVGAVTGVLVMAMRPGAPDGEAPLPPAEPEAPRIVRIVENDGNISPKQADQLLRRVKTENLKSDIRADIKEKDWKSALASSWRLGGEYRDALKAGESPRKKLGRLLEKYQTKLGRI